MTTGNTTPPIDALKFSGDSPAIAADVCSITIDGKTFQSKKGTNLIDAAKAADIEIPHYCYHPHLSVAGNCRMCQVQIKGQPKLAVACNTTVQEGMEVQTHLSNREVADAQAATLEFMLINHPLDCTVCDQSGHCKLQDYHYEYNARDSRFVEHKEHKVKAVPLGPTVMLDGERCIMCSRCVRFCDEITGTSELGLINRGDRTVISTAPGSELNNPLSGSVVDLCPVGALTHRNWRFNTRIWFTKQVDTICPGCSTGCSSKIATRDGQVVLVKARLNSAVNKEWMCDEGRYGFDRFLPVNRVSTPLNSGNIATLSEVSTALSRIFGSVGVAGTGKLAVLISPDLMLEDYVVLAKILAKLKRPYSVAVNYRERRLSRVEEILVSPDYASNFRAVEFAGLVNGDLEGHYQALLTDIRAGAFSGILLLGDRSVPAGANAGVPFDIDRDLDSDLLRAIMAAPESVGILSDSDLPFLERLKAVVPGRSILERSGMLINRDFRIQYAERSLDFTNETQPVWRMLLPVAIAFGLASDPMIAKLSESSSDRDSTVALLGADERLASLTIGTIKSGMGVPLSPWPSHIGSRNQLHTSEFRPDDSESSHGSSLGAINVATLPSAGESQVSPQSANTEKGI